MSRRMLKTGLFICCLILLLLTLAGCACKHETTEVVNAVAATCTAEGYTGDTVCTECDETVTAGEAIPAAGHTEGEVTGAAEATCTAEGYTGDTLCAVCGEKYITGEAIPVIEHTPAEEPAGAADATCTAEGYTGDIICAVCGEILTAGEAIPVIEHTPAEAPAGAADATCTAEGYTGDIICAVCGEIITAGEVIPVIEHTAAEPAGAVEATCAAEGYTGDILCAVCGELLAAGEAIPATGTHAFTDHVCTCGWMEPGLYVDGAQVKTWDELKSEGTVIVEEGVLISVEGDMQMGLLVIGEDVTYIEGRDNIGFNCNTLTAVWVPKTVTELGRYLLAGNETVAEVRLFCPVTALNNYTFSRAKGLTAVYLPATLEVIGEKAFNSCDVATVYFGGTAEQWEAIGGAALLPNAEVIIE